MYAAFPQPGLDCRRDLCQPVCCGNNYFGEIVGYSEVGSHLPRMTPALSATVYLSALKRHNETRLTVRR
jgi:hypothetical protein